MANILDTFNEKVIGAEGRLVDYVPFVASYGDFASINDLQVILNSWTNVLLTPLRTYNYDPEYGSDLYKLVFEPATQETLAKIKREVVYRLMRYDDRASIENVEVQFLKGQKAFILNITVNYRGEKDTLKTTVDSRSYLNLF